MQLWGRNVVLTGASHGIGPHLAEVLVRAGANLVLAARSATRASSAAERAGQRGGQAVAVFTDVASDQRLALVERARAALGPLDALGNNAGAETVSGSLGLGFFGARSAIEKTGPVIAFLTQLSRIGDYNRVIIEIVILPDAPVTR